MKETMYEKVLNGLLHTARPLDLELIRFLKTKNPAKVIMELKKFQNADGGFGNALEPDVRMPHSSAVATEFAINILSEIQASCIGYSEYEHMIERIVRYLWDTYNETLNGWEIVPKEVDQYPHAVWWNYDGIKGFGPFNPSATLFGFLYKHDPDHPHIRTRLEKHIELFLKTPNEEIEGHSILCLNRLKTYIKDEFDPAFDIKLNEAIVLKAEWDPDNWKNYTMEPIKYIESPEHSLYIWHKETINRNLHFLLETQKEEGYWDIAFSWHQFEEVFESTAKIEWRGFFAFENLKHLIEYKFSVI